MPDNAAPLADDLLWGARAIALEIFGGDQPEQVRRTFYLLARRLVPAEKLGSQWVGSRQRVRRRLQGGPEALHAGSLPGRAV